MWFVMLVLIGLIFGFLFGGLIVIWLDWWWIFYFNFLIGLIGIVIVMILILNVCGDIWIRFDCVGFVLFGVVFGFLLFGFELVG